MLHITKHHVITSSHIGLMYAYILKSKSDKAIAATSQEILSEYNYVTNYESRSN